MARRTAKGISTQTRVERSLSLPLVLDDGGSDSIHIGGTLLGEGLTVWNLLSVLVFVDGPYPGGNHVEIIKCGGFFEVNCSQAAD